MSTKTSSYDSIPTGPRGQITNELICLACGYDLRGLDRAGGCPECGLSIQHTVVARQGMTKRELAALVIRILAIWMAFDSVLGLLRVFGRYYESGWGQAQPTLFWMILHTGLCILLWKKSHFFSEKAVITDGPISVSGGSSLEHLMAIAMCVMGVYWIVYSISSATWFCYELLSNSSHSYADPWIGITWSAVMLITGIGLLIGSGRIAKAIHWLRTAGVSSKK